MSACNQDSHDALCLDLETFLRETYHVGIDAAPMAPGLPILLYGNCPLCASTLSVAIQEVPGYREKCREEMTVKTSDDATTASGEIKAAPAWEPLHPGRCTECLGLVAFPERPDPAGDDATIT